MVKFATRSRKRKTVATKSDDVNDFIGYATAPKQKKSKVISKKPEKSKVTFRKKPTQNKPTFKRCLTPQKALPLKCRIFKGMKPSPLWSKQEFKTLLGAM